MARRWHPKYKASCSECGWTGRRTGYTIATHGCPQCKKRGKFVRTKRVKDRD